MAYGAGWGVARGSAPPPLSGATASGPPGGIAYGAGWGLARGSAPPPRALALRGGGARAQQQRRITRCIELNSSALGALGAPLSVLVVIRASLGALGDWLGTLGALRHVSQRSALGVITNHELSLITPFSARPSRLQPCACARKRARHSAGLLGKEVCSRLVPNQSSYHGTVVHVTGIQAISPRRITILAQSSDPCTPLQSSR